MKPTLFALLLLLVATSASGIIHGHFSGRWGQADLLTNSGKQLNSLPEKSIGDWEVVEISDLSEELVDMLECAGNTTRVYRNQQIGASLNMFLIVGPHGPTVAHTPDICYSSREYEAAGEAVRKTIITGDGTRHVFWVLTMKSKRDVDPHELRVWYAWSDGEKWSAEKNPRWDYLGLPRLYKIQLASRISEKEDSKNQPIKSFLEEFLPELSKYME